jgi:carboxymethylenebutenolidase
MCHDICPHPVTGGASLQEQDLTLPLDGGESLPVFLVMPEQTPAPAVLIMHDIHGPNAFYQDLARRLAGAGFVAALPDFFFRQGPPRDDSREALRQRGAELVQSTTFDDIHAALHWLRDNGSTTGRIGTVGFCMGGSLVMLAASREPVPDASVAFYGFPVRQRTPINPILALDDDEAGSVASPLLAFWGDHDTGVGMDNVAAYDDKLKMYHKAHEFVVYPGLGHAFLTFDPNSAAFEASRDSWSRTLAFLGNHLGASRPT